MDKRYSKIYKRKGKSLRYDFERKLVYYVYIAEEDDEVLNEKKGDIIEIDGAGLKEENWRNKKARDMYLDEWIYDLEEEARYEVMYDLL